MFEGRVLNRVSALNKEASENDGENHIIRKFIIMIIWRTRIVRMGKSRNAYKILTGKPPAHLRLGLPLGRPRRRWVDNIKIDLREIEWDGMDLIDLAQDSDQWRALVNTAMNLRVP
jgi:hypothetical protein